MPFEPLNRNGNNYTITRRVPFEPWPELRWESVQAAYDFAYNMTFGTRGEHRDHRTGGHHRRRMGEIFKDTFQGKLAECALYNVLSRNHRNITLPSFDVWQLGQWDVDDYVIDGRRASVKSTKSYGNLLLLERDDFDNNGTYLPNAGTANQGMYDYFILVRMNPFCEDIMKRNRLLYSDNADYNALKNLIINEQWRYDVPGYITRDDLMEVIRDGLVIPRGATLNTNTEIDADNYYVQAGDLRDIDSL